MDPLLSPAIKVLARARHRNGIGGAPFDVFMFDDEDGRKLAVLLAAGPPYLR